ncbi:MAG: SAM-dependent methyltransferase, partial [Candidatus Dadabacteria bacterium]|nr:SAM-dependent methyltransferase [Candidatus Dadabacteria bacterium]
IKKNKPDYVIILPWNLKDEIKEQLDYINEWGGKFIIVNSRLQIL